MPFDAYSLLTTKFGALGPLLISGNSLFAPKFWDRSNIFVAAEDNVYQPRGNQNPQWGQQARFVLPKRATLLGTPLLEFALTAGTGPAGANSAAYVNNVGDQILAQVTMRYGSHILQAYPGEVQQIYRRVTQNEISEECRDELTLGNRRSADPDQEPERIRPFETGTTIYSPLDELFFTCHFDEFWMPEAFATEAEIEIDIAPAGKVIYTRGAATPAGTPVIQSVVLRAREITLTAPEKAERLNYFNSDKGMLTHMLDWELQPRTEITGTGAQREYRIPLDNIRLDMNEIFFVVRKGGVVAPSINVPWSADALDSAAGVSAVVDTAVEVSAMVEIISFRLEANGSNITNDIPGFVNRTWQRKLYHAKSTSRDYIYFYSAALIPDNRKHVTGFLNAANLGKLDLIITANLPVRDYQVDVFVHSHNIVQMRRGDAVKSIK